MKRETVKQIILTAEEGMYLTNGETYGKTVVLPEGADTYAWREIPEAELPNEELPDRGHNR